MDATFDFFPLVVVSLLAVIVPVVLHRLPRIHVPIVVGEIIAGIAVGPSGLGLIGRHPDPWLEFLALFGFAYLMFLSGLEIDFGLLMRGARDTGAGALGRLVRSPLRAAMFSFLATLAASLICATWLVRVGLGSDVVVMGLVFSTTSLGVVAPVLKERNLSAGPLGQYILVASVVGDFATVTLVSVYIILHTQGLTLELLFVLVLLAVTFLVYRVAHLSRRLPALKALVDELSHATAQLDTRGALALAVIFIALAQGLGVEVILGAFMAGAIISLISAEEGSALRPKLHALGYGFFIPIFFVMVGAGLDLEAVRDEPRGLLLVPVLVGVAYLVKLVAALVYRPVLSWRDTLALGVLTSSRLSLIIAVATIGAELGALSEATKAALILVAVITVVVSPVVFNRIVPAPAARDRRRVIIAGSTPHARLLAQRLRDHGEEVVVLTTNRHLQREIQELGVEVIDSLPERRTEDLARAGVERARALVITLDDDDAALRVGIAARERYGLETVVAHVKTPQSAEVFQRQGIEAVAPSVSSVVVLEGLVRHPHVFSLMTRADLSRNMVDVRLRNQALVGRRLRSIPLPGDALLMMIVRDGEVIVPHGRTRLQRKDLLTVVGSADSVEAAAAYLG